MVAEIISVGTELLLGQIVDTNAAWLAERLAPLGIDLYRKTVVGDNLVRCAQAIQEALKRADFVLITGGLGPTQDDVTREAIAEVLGDEIELNEDAAEHVRKILEQRCIQVLPSFFRQAYLPKSAKPIPNPVGTASGVLAEKDGKLIIAMPGVPAEMKAMFEQQVIAFLKERTAKEPAVIKSRVLRCIGISESGLTDLIEDYISNQTNPTIASLVAAGEVRLRLTAKAPTEAEADALIAELEAKIRERAGQFIFGTDEETMEKVVGDLLRQKGLTIAAAESCTGGLLTDTLTNVPGSSDYLKGGIVCYTNDVKIKQLGVDPKIVERHGEVSEECARAMAEGVRKALNADIGVGITGIAGPTGGTAEKPVGLVFIAVADANETACERHQFPQERRTVKERAVKAALNLVRKRLQDII